MKRKIQINIILLILLSPCVLMAQNTLSLSDAIRMGLENNFGIQIEENLTEQADLRNTNGRAGALPTVTLNASGYIDEELSDNITTQLARASADVNWTLFNGYSVQATKEQLENSLLLAQGHEMLGIETTVQSIINSYYYVLLQQELLEINKTIMQISNDRYEQQRVVMEIGAGGNYEYMLAKTDYLSDKTNYLTQELVVKNAVRSLNVLLSNDIDAQWKLDENFVVPHDDYSLSVMKEAMLSNSTNLKNQYLNLKAKDIEIKKMRSELYPRIGLNASFGVTATDVESVKNQNYNPQVGFNLSYTLFNGSVNRSNVAIAKLNKEVEELSMKEMILSLENELYTQFDTYMMYRELMHLEDEKVAAVELLLNLSKEKYKGGSITSFEYREVQLSYLQSAVSKLNTTLQLIAANTDLLRLTGGILSDNQ